MDLGAYFTPIVMSGFIMGISYSLGKMGFSIFWTIFMIIAHCIASYLWKNRQTKRIALQQAALWEKDVILTHLKDLPSWVHFPDTERVEWINKVIFQLWPSIAIFAKAFIKNVIEPEIKAHLPNPLQLFTFQEIDIGTIPLRVGGIKVYTENVGRDKIIIDADVVYAGDCNFIINFGPFKGGLRQMQFMGKLRAILNPLVPKPPIIGAVSLFLLDEPAIDFDLTGLGELIELPGLMFTIRSVVVKIISSVCVLPNEIIIPLMTETDTMKLQFTEPDGVLKFVIVQAKNLENKDNAIFNGKSDPYVVASVGSQFFKTKIIDDNLNPVWKETFHAVVEQSSGQRVIFEVFDHDPGSSDEFIGRLVVPTKKLRESKEKDEWYTLEGVKSGELRVIFKWLNLSRNKRLYVQNKHPSAILMVYLDCIGNLPMIKRDLEPSPFVELSLGNDQRQKSAIRSKTCNPVYQQKFTFFVVDINQRSLKLEVKNGLGSKRLLGETSIPLEFLIREEQMELLQQNFDLKLGPHVSSVVMSFRLRFLRSEYHADDDKSGSTFMDGTVDNEMPSSSYDLTIAGATLKRERQYVKNPLNKNLKSGIVQTKTIITPYYISYHKLFCTFFDFDETKIQSKPEEQAPWFDVAFSGGTHTIADKRKGVNLLRRIQDNKFLHFGKLNKRRSLSNLTEGYLGKLNISLSYDLPKKKFLVHVHRAEQLKSLNFDGVADPYVALKLNNSREIVGKGRTPLRTNTLNPVFDEKIYFDLHYSVLNTCSLIIEVKDSCNYGWLKRAPVMGCMTRVHSDSFMKPCNFL